MEKRAIIVCLLLIAYTCVLVHNIIPHHHHPYISKKHHHHNNQDHHHDDHGKDDDSKGKKNHTTDVFGFHQHPSSNKQIEHVLSFADTYLKVKLNTFLLAVDLLNFHFGPPKIPDDPPESIYSSLLKISFKPSFCSLRAPPTIIF